MKIFTQILPLRWAYDSHPSVEQYNLKDKWEGAVVESAELWLYIPALSNAQGLSTVHISELAFIIQNVQTCIRLKIIVWQNNNTLS